MTVGDDNVVVLRPELDLADEDRPVATKRREGYCLHHRTMVDPDSRRVTCRECDAEVDPVSVLLDIARDLERLILNRKALKGRADAEARRLDELKRQVRNAKAQLRRATS